MPPLAYCAPALGKQRDAAPILRSRARQARCRKAKTAPLCKGSCRRTPTEGLTASRRTQAVLPHPTIENQLNHSPGFTIPPAWLRHAVPPLHKGGPVSGRPYYLYLGAHNGPFLWHWARTASRPLPVLARQHRSTGANNAYSLQRVLGPAARWWISLFFPPFLWQISS